MILSIDYYPWLRELTAAPMLIVAWAAFGVPMVMLLSSLPVYILRKIGLPLPNSLATIFYTSTMVTWITGFVTTIILLFSEIAGIRMLLIWCLMYIFYFVFCVFYHRPLYKWIDSTSKKYQPSEK